MGSVIDIKGLHKSFGGNHVLRGQDLDILKGESIVILGQSGCGKSVLLKHIIGVMLADQGEIWMDGVDITKLPETEMNTVRRRFGFVFQGGALFDSMSVAENTGFALSEHSDMSDEEISDVVSEKLALVGLEGTEKLMPAELSGGMKKRVAVARAITF